MNKQRGFSAVEGLIIVLVVAVISFAGYTVWNNGQDDEAEVAETSQKETQYSDVADVETSDPEDEVAKDEATTATASTELFSTGYRNEETGILIDFIISSGFSDYWVEYGQTSDGLSSQTEKRSSGLGYAIESFGGFTAIINPADLPEGDNIYFYRVAATKNGTAQYTGISAFNYK